MGWMQATGWHGLATGGNRKDNWCPW
jgi:hypothetical protein